MCFINSNFRKAHKKTDLGVKILDADPKKSLEYFNDALAVDPELLPALLGRAGMQFNYMSHYRSCTRN